MVGLAKCHARSTNKKAPLVLRTAVLRLYSYEKPSRYDRFLEVLLS